LLTIINDILDFSKMEAGKIDLELIEFGPVALVEGCAELLASSARERGLSLMTYIDRKVPRMLQGDPVRLRQVLLNLTSNAIKFTERGEVSVRVTCAEENSANLVLLFEVSDTGIGLPDTARKLLFQPFTQADGSTSRRYGGTGLGLSICKRLVELMGGKIDVQSSPGIGSRFWFTVPFDLPASNPDDPDDTFRRDIRALVFDDSEATASTVSLYLEANGIEAESAPTMGEMLKLIEEAIATGVPYQLVLLGVTGDTDISDPSIDKILSAVSGQPTRLILLTTLDDRERIESMLRRGFCACLSKPIRQSQLLETVNRALSLPVEPHAEARHVRAAKTLELAMAREEIATEKPLLVAEDNPVMQELAVRRIRKMGLEVKAVNNGREVLEAMVGQEYALILMDCQMPEMDGFEATAAIRRQEATTGRHTPIVAMTAAAMIGDRENCLTSGMDDYLSKPVSQEQLVRVLRKWLPRDSQFTVHITPGAEDIPPAYKQPQPVCEIPELPLDLAQLEKLYGRDLSTNLLASFVQESADLAQLLEVYAKSRDAQGLAQQAHQLKGLASVMTAEKVATSCIDLERAVKDYDWEVADLALGKVQAELGAAVAYVTGLIAAGDDE
jgi:CheY-like chemotaxis protein/HPt (histidine-containing phosphotransfer) domain-containing protein/anti-sigma regulatory factor (Ser/Thr protein kinase)